VDALQRADQLAPGEPLIIEHLGDAYQRSAKRGLAAQTYRRALEAIKGAGDQDDVRDRRDLLLKKLKMLGVDTADR
ncbi:MAG: tetratricopeptide repeat protein, partial [Myxococcaceae bacterium]